jgi:predicted  nucleic acid-binding Zn-ribbon protein
MSAALGLYRLQQVDTQIDQIQARQKKIQETLQNDLSLRTATQAFDASENNYKDAARTLKQSETDVEKQRIKIEQAESSLYSGHVHNPKELQDLQKDIVSLKKYMETLEERELEAMLTAENAEKEFHAAKAELEQTQANVKEQNRDLSQENDALIKDLERLESERKAVISDLAQPAVDNYDQLRKQRRGIAVTKVTDSTCDSCGTTLTLAHVQSARSASQLINCPTCGRILYAN